jgi:hypothetical protein
MRDLGRLIWSVLLVLLRSRAALAAENLVLRQHACALRRTAPKRPFLSNVDRLIFVCLYRLFPDVLAIVKPQTIIRWHRWGCKLNGVDPQAQAYLTDVLTKLVNLWPAARLDELMPWAWARAQKDIGRSAA